MKNVWSLLVTLLMLVSTGAGQAQRRGPEGGPGMRGQGRLEKFKMMRLVEVLKLSEEDAARFVAINRAHEDQVRDLMKSRNAALDDIEKLVRDKKEGVDLEGLTHKVLEMDQQVFAERVRFQGEVKKLVTPVQFAQFLVYERNFGRRVRNALEEMPRDGGGRERD